MGTAARLVGFAATLGLVFGGAWWVGTLTDLPGDALPSAAAAAEHAEGADAGAGFAVESAGLVSTAGGFTLVPRGPTTLEPDIPAELAFVVTGAGGRPVREFEMKDERLLDLVVVRRDGAAFQHLDPTIGPDGVWRAPLTLPEAGVYRAYAEFEPTGGPALVLGIELSAPGRFAPEVFPTARADHVAGYDVRLTADLVAGRSSQVVITIDRDRVPVPVADLEPYLGGRGHLVVLRQSDLAYLRVAPDAPAPDAPAPDASDHLAAGLAFMVDVPAAGGHRLFLEFRHDGVVHTAELTASTGSGQ